MSDRSSSARRIAGSWVISGGGRGGACTAASVGMATGGGTVLLERAQALLEFATGIRGQERRSIIQPCRWPQAVCCTTARHARRHSRPGSRLRPRQPALGPPLFRAARLRVVAGGGCLRA